MAEKERTRLGLPCRGARLPLGNLTSQLLTNYYLSGMDHLIKEKLRIRHYIRYMDDFTLLHHDRSYLKHCRAEIEDHLAGIGLNPKTQDIPAPPGDRLPGLPHLPDGDGEGGQEAAPGQRAADETQD